MSEDISVQILTQSSENIQKLFDLSTRIDERVKMIQVRQEQMDKHADDIRVNQIQILQKIAVLESKGDDIEVFDERISNLEKAFISVDKRLDAAEGKNEQNSDRWNRIFGFVVQLIWVVLAAYVLTKMNLQSPAVP